MALLFTPGPLTTSAAVRAAMGRDWGSRDPEFTKLTAAVRASIGAIANANPSHDVVLIQGSGTHAVEAAIATLLGTGDKLLVLINGEYGRRIADIANRQGKQFCTLEFDELLPVETTIVARLLDEMPEITTVAIVHLETTTGILNPLEDIAAVVNRAGKRLIVDAMASFGAYDLDLQKTKYAAVIAASGKCLHGVPGVGFVIADKELLSGCEGNSASLTLDLYEQSVGFRKNGQWRFTPPTHCVAALATALEEHQSDGGCHHRLAVYHANAERLLERMAGLGFTPTLGAAYRSPVIITFNYIDDEWFDFDLMYLSLSKAGFNIYPGKMTRKETFRVGCIGAVEVNDIDALADNISYFVSLRRLG